jgi:hypothetical protein
VEVFIGYSGIDEELIYLGIICVDMAGIREISLMV